ncbi:fused diaminohydroxyphosphoribosylaminopyrimidine deaminase; 5-amino-6-(5-phosphoribosylamino) uracil reductase [Candidatus Hydrogenisulfobacillus filiaventi]|uniref:Riboflavin biosynthesis protein RibD n=1 Tax=Candidatus Hydrogenisulfobacillus filiaventi TaxID=2707344 RepID=A0A6F8ZJF4_9FIRM|nr:bifunctional diaminohydroxyphosphoribosylaminopyrimidine deaminase/5-amino-6-(5-phosphoribosylamino)uracil reductase RibD [Bacillota bacterium]CAB1130011.1 fused diaminohydroxyphosphoribosylaminopyrimidine deaminase; 5-amino-6-(5-phosphoribosylamino) uracil reductase [Candidatus Hydrogenisulfobacillus filiaventi]
MTSEPMRRALALARRARGRTAPNPMVGAVIVKDGQVIGEGYHHRAGGPHAEVLALRQAGEAARGATLYVTLAPCNHHGRTPPCTDAILAAGIAKVVAAMPDPNPVAGGGLERLQAAGVEVEVGDGAAEAEALNRPFLTWARHHRPLITLKVAASVDGRVATRTGRSKYLTGPEALAYTHRLRREHDAILVGSGTLLADDPLLTDRGPGRRRDPVRVILDGRGRTPPGARVFRAPSPSPILVFTTAAPGIEWERAVFAAGGEVIRVEADAAGHPRLEAVLEELADRHLQSVLVEGGPTIHAAFLQARLADRWVGFIAPLWLGGPVAAPVWGVDTLEEAPRITFDAVRRLGSDVVLEGEIRFPAAGPAPAEVAAGRRKEGV